jgi:hypothetical protein
MLRLEDLNVGDVVIVDGGFDCMSAGPKVVHADERGELYVPCLGPIGADGTPEDPGPCQHFLAGQEDEDGSLVGISRPA